jgi:phosphoribosylformylglycinamidine synthase subunit PurQ / glutaminase
MRAAVLVFPASNCDRDLATALKQITGHDPLMIWHEETSLPPLDLITIPGGFSYGDYLRCGAMAARAPIMQAVKHAAARGVPVLGICNGFQILTEAGLLPGVLLRNQGLRFLCRDVELTVHRADTAFTRCYQAGQRIRLPIAHHDGNYYAPAQTLERLKGQGCIAFSYQQNPNGSAENIAGIFSENFRVLGMMPHPERYIDAALGGRDGALLFQSVVESLV